jgi:tRNA G10  N-methylase Trm11
LARRCIQAGCKPGGTVLDPFHGSGTTGLAAERLDRRYIGVDLNANYLQMSLETRLRQPPLDFGATNPLDQDSGSMF